MSQATINGNEIFTTYGLTIMAGMETFLAYPKRKDSVSHDWPEEEGIDIDLSEPHFEAREFTLKVLLMGADRADFKTKYYGLFAELSSANNMELYFTDIDQTFTVYFKTQQNVSKVKRRLDTQNVGVTFDLVFGESDPNDNIDVFIVTDLDEFIIA
ncbi:hypothetical protein [Mucilaginibacter sp. L3T2-6]|uniref:hypothetical protein n=1 Tax=Mucilaginibacter sp. L3T2-6 TaxID=3062491 RepID=UPI0026746342|nr:hypothetical protein [Mucilaginibacter sp. L3T2-6]MDO3641979.1 hypothetical protein [Mucilaginibacter sp. L3T2-6]MDV6214343.1 hypothetical protein [Mucilaginibacter sp. L3T2-6]